MQILRVDMSELTLTRTDTDDRYKGWAARGLIGQVAQREIDPLCHPLGAGNKLIIANGLLAGTRTSSSGRLSVGGKSPLTGGIKEASAGGIAGDALARLGLRAIIVEGLPPTGQSFILRVGPSGDELISAGGLRGRGVYELAEVLRLRYGLQSAVICIGPGGELRLPVAAVMVTDPEGAPSRAAARGGMGAVMGAKGLKAIVLEPGNREIPMSDRVAFRKARKRFTAAVSQDPGTDGFARLGTAQMLDPTRELGGLPVHNFRRGDVSSDLTDFTGEGVAHKITERGGSGKTTHACMPGCVIRCSNVFPDAEGKTVVSPLEFESIVLLGPNIGVYDLDRIAQLNRMCNDLGIDTMEIGVAIGVAMEAAVLSFGDYVAASRLLDEVAAGSLLGKVLGQGAAITGQVFGVERVPAVRGQAMAGYDPRAVKGLGVTYATSPMGADHTAGFVFGPMDQHKPGGQVQASWDAQVVRTAIDAVGLCLFALGPVESRLELVTDLINSVEGTGYDPGMFLALGRTVLQTELRFNAAAGVPYSPNWIPEFMRVEGLGPEELTFDVPQDELDSFFEQIMEERGDQQEDVGPRRQ